MHTEVFNNIDTLISMADSPLNIDEINTELITLRRQINNKKNEIEDLKSLMTESRYFNASNELVDKNIEISLKNKINRLNRKIKDLKNTIDDIKNREKSVHNDIAALKDKLTLNSNYVKTLEKKAKESSSNTYYQELLTKEQKNVTDLSNELEEKSNLYNSILEELKLNNQAHKELSDKLTNEKNHLNDILDNLNNPNAYLDEELKKSDEEKLSTLETELENLEKRKLELLTDANMIGSDAKEFIISNDIISALNKVKELITIVKTKPYMDINNPDILDEELEKKESLRNELSSLIDNRAYENLDNNSLNKRINYIKETITQNEDTIKTYQLEINKIDEIVNSSLGKNITELEEELLKLEKSITEYRTIVKDKNKSTRTKANLENVIAKKEKERDILNDILSNYKENLLAKIERTNILDNINKSLEEENNKFNYELNKLSKLSMLDLRTKDLVSEEEDKDKLKQVNEEIKAIKNRQKFSKTPDEIFDEIDMYLATVKPKEENKTPKAKQEPEIKDILPTAPTVEVNVPDLVPTIEVPKEVPMPKTEPEMLKVIDIIPVETIKEKTGGN